MVKNSLWGDLFNLHCVFIFVQCHAARNPHGFVWCAQLRLRDLNISWKQDADWAIVTDVQRVIWFLKIGDTILVFQALGNAFCNIDTFMICEIGQAILSFRDLSIIESILYISLAVEVLRELIITLVFSSEMGWIQKEALLLSVLMMIFFTKSWGNLCWILYKKKLALA